MSEQRLSLLQHWMKTLITERGDLDERLRAAALRHGLSAEDVVAERRGLPARERLGIYAGGYVLRLLECMRADFPALLLRMARSLPTPTPTAWPILIGFIIC